MSEVEIEKGKPIERYGEKMNVMLHRDERDPSPKMWMGMWIFATVHVVAMECIVYVDARRVRLPGRNICYTAHMSRCLRI